MAFQAPVYFECEHLHPKKEISRGRFGAGVLLVHDAKKYDYVVVKRVAMRYKESFERQVTIHIRASMHACVLGFMGLLPSSTSCFQYALEYIPGQNLQQFVVANVGLPDLPCKCIIRQILRSLTYFHNDMGIIHGSLKPDHILLSSTNRCVIKICNFSYSYPVGTTVKMNTESTARSVPWKKQLRRFRSFFDLGSSSVRISSRSSSRQRKSIDHSAMKSSQEPRKPFSKRPRSFSVIPAQLSTPLKSPRQVDIHEYTTEDFLKEIENDMFSKAFTAPELINASRYVASPASDYWSFVILMIFCLTGSTPWEAASVKNRKYTAFLHTNQRSNSFTPQLNEKNKENKRISLSNFRSKSLSSLVDSIKRRSAPPRTMSPIFEKKVTEILKQPANRRKDLKFSDEFFTRCWGDDIPKLPYYTDHDFDLKWMKQKTFKK